MDESLDGIFDDIVGGVAKVVTAPVDLVAKALPKPIRKPFKAVSTLASPTQMVARAAAGGRKRRRRKPTRRRTTRRRTRPKLSTRGMFQRTSRARKVSPAKLRAKYAASSGREDLLKTMVKVLGAKDIAKVAASARPRLAARSSGSGSKAAGDKVLIQLMANAVSKKLAPDLRTINKRLKLAENQRLATSEHLALNSTSAFRKKVLQDLLRMSTCLPANHPTRQRIRRIGLMSGLL